MNMQKTMALVLAAGMLSLRGFAAEPNGLLADWQFQSGCTDFSGHGLDGQLGGFKIAEEPVSKIHCALNDGSLPDGVWMTVPDNPQFKDISALTIVFKVKGLPSNTGGWLLYKTAPGGCDFGLLFDTGPVRIDNKEDSFTNYRIGLKLGSVMKWFLIDRTQYPPTEWNRFAITGDLKGDRIPRLYINKKPVAQSDSFGLDDFYPDDTGDLIGTVDFYEFNDTTLPYSGKPLFIGGANIIKKNSFQGYIDEVMLFNKALPDSELIQQPAML